MKLTDEEQIKIKDAFNLNNNSYVGSVWGSKLIWSRHQWTKERKL